MYELLSNFLSEFFTIMLFGVMFYLKQKGLFKKFTEEFPSKEYFYDFKARLELIELNIENINRKLLNLNNTNMPVAQQNAIRSMRKTQ